MSGKSGDSMRVFYSRRAQATLEFMMTYGWALLVVLVAIGALAFFNVFEPGNVLPDQCVISAGLGCYDPYAAIKFISLLNTNYIFVSFTFINGQKDTMKQATISLSNATGSSMPGCDDDLPLCSSAGLPASFETVNCIGLAQDVVPDQVFRCGYFEPAWTLKVGDRIVREVKVRWTDLYGNQRSRSGTFAAAISEF